MKNKINWCFKLRDGLKLVEPNGRLSKSYIEQAKFSLLRAEKNLNDKDFLWATVTLYYAEYYALYSFLQKIGIKCENHTCSILAATFLLGDENIKIINKHKDKRIDAQYYIKIDHENKIRTMLQEAKNFIANFDNIISNLSEADIQKYREKMKL